MYLEKKDFVFTCAPIVQDVAIEFGITDEKEITAMYEVFKRTSGYEREYLKEGESYENGYEDGFNAAIDQVIGDLDDLSCNLSRQRKR